MRISIEQLNCFVIFNYDYCPKTTLWAEMNIIRGDSVFTNPEDEGTIWRRVLLIL
jgi:hypothetical protein